MRASVAFAAALDLLIGDPASLAHPVTMMGAAIRVGEPFARRYIRDEALAGAALALGVIGAAALTGRIVRRWAPLRVVTSASTLAVGSLIDHLVPVRDALERGDLPSARAALARCVGRDTEGLDEAQIARAAIETLAESLCDGVVAPLLFLRFLGLAGALAYKAINTLDSTIGHIEPPYARFGRFAARVDDVANVVPARVSALLIAACAPLGGGRVLRALRCWRTDGRKHRSPNAGVSEAAMAGALGVRLGGNNTYDGVAHASPELGAAFASPSARDVGRAMEIVFSASIVAIACASW
ncbi:MAG TPA: adenosylcobinamide-phosphate synthase CbiB [Candidatus Baltobacteraceae bacterium]|nr:adenosylcobinamide-phosphate synthase CbiB [Candidatus Baltobacteraceae bacterium]